MITTLIIHTYKATVIVMQIMMLGKMAQFIDKKPKNP